MCHYEDLSSHGLWYVLSHRDRAGADNVCLEGCLIFIYSAHLGYLLKVLGRIRLLYMLGLRVRQLLHLSWYAVAFLTSIGILSKSSDYTWQFTARKEAQC